MSIPRITIAVDGYSSCGKSTLARALAQSLDYLYIDSGAMYRAVTLYVLEQGIAPRDWVGVEGILRDIRIRFEMEDGAPRTILNGRDVEDRIRNMDVSSQVSPIATIPAVRRKMVDQQQQLGAFGGIVMDGRDIGTVVFPQAKVKLFLTAGMEERVRRRQKQLLQKGKDIPAADIRRNLFVRDYIDATRSDSPLMKAAGAVVIDNTNLSPVEQLSICMALVKSRLYEQPTGNPPK